MRSDAQRSSLSGDLLIELVGQTIDLPDYALRDGDDAVLKDGAFGPCYLTELAASRWSAFWAERLSQHAQARGLIPLGRRGAWVGWRYPNVPEIEMLRDDGVELHVRLDQPRAAVDGGILVERRREEYTLRLGEDNHGVLEEVDRRLRDEGAFPLLELFDTLNLTHRLRETVSLRQAALLFDEELYEYWPPSAITAIMAYSVFVPNEAAPFLNAGEAA